MRIRQAQMVERRILQVDHRSTFQTDEMMMAPGFYLKARGRVRVAHFSGHADPDKRLQSPINRGPRDLRKPLPDFIEELIGGRVIQVFRQRLQNDAPLHG